MMCPHSDSSLLLELEATKICTKILAVEVEMRSPQ